MYIFYKEKTAQAVVNIESLLVGSRHPMLFSKEDTGRLNLLAKFATISLSFD